MKPIGPSCRPSRRFLPRCTTPTGLAIRSTDSSSPGSKSAGLKPAAEADRYTLVRRVSLDLTGLLRHPRRPTRSSTIDRRTPTKRLVDRLLASPHYGERWARHWLDLARYADTNGYEKDRVRSIWPYRDWVIAAINAGMPSTSSR